MKRIMCAAACVSIGIAMLVGQTVVVPLVLAVSGGGTGSSNGSITGTTQLNLAAGGANQPVVLSATGSGDVEMLSPTSNFPVKASTTGSVPLYVYADAAGSGISPAANTRNMIYLQPAVGIGFFGNNSQKVLLPDAGGVFIKPVLFSALPPCAAGTEGQHNPVTDSTANTWGATVTGGGANRISAYCDGTNWTVYAK